MKQLCILLCTIAILLAGHPASAQAIKPSFTCTINGKPFIATNVYAHIESDISDGTLQIMATDGKITIELLLPNEQAVAGKKTMLEGGISLNSGPEGSYTIMPDKLYMKAQATCTATVLHRSAIRISGSFNFTATNNIIAKKTWVTVAQGKFDVPISKE